MSINPRSHINRFMLPTRSTEYNITMFYNFQGSKKSDMFVGSLFPPSFSFLSLFRHDQIVLSRYCKLSSNTSSSALTVADKTKDELQKDYKQRQLAPPSSFTNSNRTMASRSDAGQAPSAIPIVMLVSTYSSNAPTSSSLFLLQPSIQLQEKRMN